MAALDVIRGENDAQDVVQILLLGLSRAVAAMPEGLPATLTWCWRWELDKAGTLTENEMTVERVVTSSGEVELTGVGYWPEGFVHQGGERIADPALATEESLVLAGRALASNAQLGETDGVWASRGT